MFFYEYKGSQSKYKRVLEGGALVFQIGAL
jgi:hypothetical protein